MMKHLVTIFFLVFAFGKSNGQERLRRPVDVEVACGFAGQNSKEITAYHNFIINQNYSTLRANLYTGSPLEILLSAVALKELAASGKLTLTNREQERLKTISLSKQKYTLCYTCTLQLEGTFMELFSQKQDQIETVYEIIKFELFRTR